MNWLLQAEGKSVSHHLAQMKWTENDIASVLADIDRIEETQSPDELLLTLSDSLGRWSIHQVVLMQLINPARATKPLQEYGITNYPDEWIKNWFEQGRAVHDPIVRYGAGSRRAFDWQDARQYAGKIGRRMMDEGRDFGLKSGIGIPVTIPRMPTGLIAIPHDEPDFSDTDLIQIELLCIHAYTHFLNISGAKPDTPAYEMTERETEIMHYVAAGKTNWEIATILGINENTVAFHLKNVARKTNTTNRAHSVAISIKDGKILP